jgi:predicted MFS family arabinose efflux permease
MGFVNAHFVAYATDLGASTIASASALASVGAMSIVGALIFGFFADRRGARPSLAISFALRGIGYAVLLMADSLPVATLGIMVIGLSWTSVISLTGVVSADQFGNRRLGTVYGTIFSIMPLGHSLAMWFSGHVFDTTGTYQTALWVSMALGLAASVIVGLPRYRQLAPARAVEPTPAGA